MLNLLTSLCLLCALAVFGCTAQVSDLDDLETNPDACDPRGKFEVGTDLDLQLVGLTPHINQSMFFAITVGEERSIEALMVLSTLDDPDLHLRVEKLLPEGPSELAFWADSMPPGFDEINDDDDPIDHQWTRPLCPNGRLTFTHNTPFQDVQDAVSTGAILLLQFPDELQRPELFDNFRMWARAILLDEDNEDLQTRAFFRWSPLVPPARGEDTPEQRPPPAQFQVGGDALGESRGAIDQLSFYRIEFVIDVDDSGDLSGDDFVCSFREQAPDEMTWRLPLDLDDCDMPADFDPRTFEP